MQLLTIGINSGELNVLAQGDISPKRGFDDFPSAHFPLFVIMLSFRQLLGPNI